MVRKLKSISKPIRWSLLTRAAIFGSVWFFLPFWFFLLTALYLYFVPIFQPFRLFFPFLLVLFFAATASPNVYLALLLIAAFYMLLGIKDFILINRKAAHEILILLLLFLSYTRFFSRFDSGAGLAAFFYSIVLAASSFILIKGFLRYKPNSGEELTENEKESTIKRPLVAALVSLIIWHFSLALLFAPINFLYQSIILFVSAAILIEIIPLYLGGALTGRRIMTFSSVFFTLTVLILATARWGL